MIKYILVIIAILVVHVSFAQKISYKEWQEQAKTEIRLLPEYGHVPKTQEQKDSDEELIKAELKQDGTHRKASDALIRRGFDYLYRGDLKTAMYRFNQAYLLDATNENIYWGYGAIYGAFNDYQTAIVEYDKGLVINPHSSIILTDKATMFMSLFQVKHNKDYLNKALNLFNQSYQIDPSNQNTLFKLSAYYYYNNDCKNAWRYYNECMKLGGQQMSAGYGDALKKTCPN